MRKSIRSSRRPRRGAGWWLRTTMAPPAGANIEQSDCGAAGVGGPWSSHRARVHPWVSRWRRGPLSHAQDDQETFDRRAGLHSLSSAVAACAHARTARSRVVRSERPRYPVETTASTRERKRAGIVDTEHSHRRAHRCFVLRKRRRAPPAMPRSGAWSGSIEQPHDSARAVRRSRRSSHGRRVPWHDERGAPARRWTGGALGARRPQRHGDARVG
jgi:hypothetical protein